MRRPLTAVLSLLLALGFSLVALDTATAAPPTRAKPKESTRVVTAPIDIWKAAAAQTPGGRLDYCAVTVFVVFPEIDGYEATTADYVVTSQGVPSEASYPLVAPYDDQFTWGPLSRSALAGKHQVVLGGQPSAWSAGSPDCEAPYATTAAYYPTTAQVTYEATEKCAAAIDAYNSADEAVAKARKKLDRAKTPAQKAAARLQLLKARSDLAKAKARWKKRC